MSGCSSQYLAPQITADNRKQPTIACAPFHVLVIKSDGTLWGIGEDDCGSLGLGPNAPKRVTVLTRIGTDNDWATVTAAQFNTMAIKKDGTLWGWGSNGLQQLGFNGVSGGLTRDVPAPRQLGTDTDWKIVRCGFYCTIAIKTNGTLWIWGYDGSGLQYNSTRFAGSRPEVITIPSMQVGSDTDWAELPTESSTISVAIKNDGSLWTWEKAGLYKIDHQKDFDVITHWIDTKRKAPRNMTTRIGRDKWAQVACLGGCIVGLRTNGTLWFWDLSPNGTYTPGILVDSNPSQIGTDNDWVSISGGCVFKKDGSLWSLFANNKLHPHKITEDNNWVEMNGNVLLKSDGTLWSLGWDYSKPLGQCNMKDYNPAALIPVSDK
jgi:alpha-tubulin suppressor-like RCC1 family protein